MKFKVYFVCIEFSFMNAFKLCIVIKVSIKTLVIGVGAAGRDSFYMHLARRHRWPHCATVFGATVAYNDRYRIDDMPKRDL